MSVLIFFGLALALDNGNYNAVALRGRLSSERVSPSDNSLNCPAGTTVRLTQTEFKDRTNSWSPYVHDKNRWFRRNSKNWEDHLSQETGGFYPPSLWFSSGRLQYPKKFLQKFQKGKVVVTVFINELGTVSDAMVSCSSDDFFNESAIEYAKRMSFYPGTFNGRLVRSVAHQPIEFGVN